MLSIGPGTSTPMMSAPSSARRTAWLRPCPRAIPVMKATLPATRPAMVPPRLFRNGDGALRAGSRAVPRVLLLARRDLVVGQGVVAIVVKLIDLRRDGVAASVPGAPAGVDNDLHWSSYPAATPQAIDLVCRNSDRPCSPHSRPRPLCLYPPNAAYGLRPPPPPFRITVPVRNCRAMLYARTGSPDHTPPPRPTWLSFARRTASSSVRNGIMMPTGPKNSLCAICIALPTPLHSVGSTKNTWSRPPCLPPPRAL